ncbi:MAG TPA: M24 family metallopeptidase [Solirubrobacteraceae bacterium]
MNILIYGDTTTSPAMRHELPLTIGDPFLYLESDGRRVVLTNALEEARIAQAAPEVERLLGDALGRDELISAGYSRTGVELELCVRAVAAMSLREAVVPPEFPVALADRLRADGVEITPDDTRFSERRRRKTKAELAGIRRAAGAAVEAMREAATRLREAELRDGQLWHAGERLTSEAVRARIREVCGRLGAVTPPDVMVKTMGQDPRIGHYPGSGPLPVDTPILIDLWPQDEESGCWADMTRTFVRGEVSDAVGGLYELVMSAHERSCGAVRPGVAGVELYELVCEIFEAAGHPTQRTKPPDKPLREGFHAALGHGVGLEVHEAPALGRTATEGLIAGDVIAIEPGLVVRSVGGVRVEDLLIVTDQGSENLTGMVPHELHL